MKSSGDIAPNSAYKTSDTTNLDDMIATDRYANRSDIFDDLIAKTNDHFWDPMDVRYVDYSEEFDIQSDFVLPPELFPEINTVQVQSLSDEMRLKLINENTRWMISGLLHGEQAALMLCSQMSMSLLDPGAQEYAANQAREEARHVTAFSRYVNTRWGSPYPVGDVLGGLLNELIDTPLVYKKLIGMQILVEGLAMGLLAVIYSMSADPLLKRISQLVMTDESFHHKFGKTWAEKTVPNITQEEHLQIEDWAALCFKKLMNNLVDIEQRHLVFSSIGLDWREVKKSYETDSSVEDKKAQLQQQGNVFRSLAKTLIKSNIVTDRTLYLYDQWLDVKTLEGESDALEVVSELVSKQGVDLLKEINRKRRSWI
ncbi:hypothetical protein A9Q99_24415 [Gammaproteobacteria bacterium 45_16_T64]|nr:hypothetical protein A9Q99_24415 [Gammaproteobacteria bacterium 45_16_T64]